MAAAPPATLGRERLELTIEAMHCASCVARNEDALGGVAGVDEASVNLATGRVTVSGGRLDPATLTEAVDRAGYTASPAGGGDGPAHARPAIEGMHCAGCVSKIEDSLRSTPGVTEAVVNLANGEASVGGAAALRHLPEVQVGLRVEAAVGLVGAPAAALTSERG